MKEEHFFLENNDKKIYTVRYDPENKKSNTGIILAKPIWGERIRTHRIFTNLARTICKEGFFTITCDYYGDGNSYGETRELSFDGMVDDLNRLFSFTENEIHIKDFILIGFRLGADAAMRCAEKNENIKKLILIEPVLDLPGFLMAALRANLTNQFTVYKKVIKNRESLIEDLKNDIPVNIDGFLIGKKFWSSFENNNIRNFVFNFDKSVKILELLKKNKRPRKDLNEKIKYKNAEFENLEREFEWDGWKSHVPFPAQFIDYIRTEIISG
jgi:alpha/beta superfamily hydrolase